MTVKFQTAYPLKKRLFYTLAAITAAILIAGFWNYHLVDGFGKEIVAGSTIGNTSDLADDYGTKGSQFGLIFAAIAGLAATFTACNCVIFAMIPGLACSVEDDQPGTGAAWKAFGCFVAGVLVITGSYGFFIGFLGAEGMEILNGRAIRLAQAQAVFTLLGFTMLIWGFLEMGFLDNIKNRFSDTTRAFFDQTTTKALLLGILVGCFAIGRPFPVFREFLVYAASANSSFYGAGVMMIQGLGQIAVMALLFGLIVGLAGNKMSAAARQKPYKFRMVSSTALIAGGMYFIYYWGLAFVFDIGGWGFKLGWY
ncbi:MAG TPA: cytochrome c biogenesis protein CcdA [Fodinibius sp.]|nr:cytochrome c biogenesis protein CcdA [Fodinibius sp.]